MVNQQQQQLLPKEVFSPQITKFRREIIIPLYKDETWSADLIDKSSLSKYNNNYKFILTVIDIFTKYACAIPLKNKSGLSITNGFKTILSEGPQSGSESPQGGFEVRKPEKLWVDRGSEFYNKTFKSLPKEHETKLYSTYSDLEAVFIERFNRTLLHIIIKPMFVNGDGNWVNILNDAVITYNNNIYSTINMTPVDASRNPDKVKYYVKSTKATPKLKVGDYVRNADKRNIFSKGYTSNWNRELFKVHEVLNTQPLTYKIEDMNGDIIEGKYYEQELIKSELDFESNNTVFESLKIFNINNDNKQIQSAKHQSGNQLLGSTSTISSADLWHNLTPGKARWLFLEDNDNINVKVTYKIINVQPPIDEKVVVNKEYCDNNLLYSNNKIDILGKNITELRKGEFDKVTTKTLQLNETQVNDELINELIESANEVTNTFNFCNKVAADTISKYNQLKEEFDNNEFNQNITNIQLDEMFTTGLKEFKEVNKKTNSFIDEALLIIKRQ